MRHLIALISTFTLSSCLPSGPDGANPRTLCLSSAPNAPVCKDIITEDDDTISAVLRSDDSVGELCDILCQSGVPVEGCECLEATTSGATSAPSEETTTTAAASTTTTTDLCQMLCESGEGGTLCNCEGLPPAFRDVQQQQQKPQTQQQRPLQVGSDRGNEVNLVAICYHVCRLGGGTSKGGSLCGC